MCGILGSFCGAAPLPPTAIRHADLDALRHRGPDSYGWHTDTHAVMGFRRLSIIDVSGGDQPIPAELPAGGRELGGGPGSTVSSCWQGSRGVPGVPVCVPSPGRAYRAR